MFYHIICITKTGAGKDVEKGCYYQIDFSDEQKLKAQYVKPYLNGDDFLIGGARIKNSEVESISIFQSENSLVDIVKAKNAEGTWSYSTKNILFGEMVNRDEYLKEITVYAIESTRQESSEDKIVIQEASVSKAEKKELSRAIFIVHGHDDLAIHQIKEFLRKLKFNPIVLREQANSGRTIIEKLIDHTQPNEIGYGIVLYTPCDKGCASGHEADLKSRARQNVVFEHGLLMGCLGRSRVHALVKGDIETPGDLGVVVYTAMDEPGAWQLGIIKELKALGYEVDANLL